MMQGGDLPEYARVHELLQYLHRLYPEGLPLTDVVQRTHIEHLLKKDTSHLSGGERRRVQFAAALMANPRLFVLDEPTEGMDLDSRMQFWALLRKGHSAGWIPTVIFTTHDLHEAERFADRILVLNHGQIVAADSPENLKQTLSRALLRFSVAPDIDVHQLLQPFNGDIRDLGGHRYEIRTDDGDRAIRYLVQEPGVFAFELIRGSLDEAFRTAIRR